MASLRVLAFDHEGRPVAFDTWLDDLQLNLLSDTKDSVSLFDHVSGATTAPPATADSATRSQWLSCDADARLAIRNHLPVAECTHFGQHRTAHALYDAVVAHYSSPATGALGRLLLPYLFPELDHFLSLDATSLTIDLLQQHLLAAETSAVAVDVSVAKDVRAASASAKCRSSKGKGGKGGGGGSGGGGGGSGSGGGGSSGGGGGSGTGGGSGGSGGGGGGSSGSGGSGGGGTGGGGTSARRVGSGGGQRQQQQRRSETQSPQQLRFAIFDLDFDAILSAMYALSISAKGDCYRCVPPDPGIATTALGAAPAQALHTFTLDSGASCCFFRDSTILTPLPAPVPVRLADPSGGPVVARSSTVLPCPVVPSSSLSGLHLPSFSTNLVSAAALQDAMITTTTPRGSSLYTLATEPPQVAASAQVSASGQVAASCSCRLLLHQTFLSLHPLPASPAPPCLPCVEGRQRAAPHSSSFPSTIAPLQTLHMDMWGPARVSGQGRERYFLLVVDDYTRYTTVFPLPSKGEVSDLLIPWTRTVCLQLRERFGQDLPVLRLHSDRGGEFSSDLLRDFCCGEGILQSFTLLDSPQQKGIAERRIGLVMEVARTSMIHAAAPHFLWPFAVRYAAHQLNLWPRDSLPETSPTLRWTEKVGDASVFRVWGSRAFVRDTSADKLSARAIPRVFLGFVPDVTGWLFYHPTSHRVFPSQDVTFDELVPFYRLFPYHSATPPPPQLFLAPAVSSGAGPGTASGGAEPRGAESEGAGSGGVEPGGEEPGGAEPAGVETGGVEPGGAESEDAESRGAEPRGAGDARARGVGVTAGAGGIGGTVTTGLGGARTRGTGAAGTGGVEGVGVGDPTETGAAGAGGTGAGGAGAGGAGAAGAGAVDPGAGGPGDTVRRRPYFVPLLQQPASPLPAPSPYTGLSRGLKERREPASRPVSPVRTARCVPRSRLPPVPGTHTMALRPSSVPMRVPLPSPPESSLPEVPDPESDRARAACPTVSRLLATTVSDPSFQSAAASALVAELLDFAATCRLDYAIALVAESASASPPSVGGECALGTDVLEDSHEDFECISAAVPRFASMLLAPEGDPDAPDIPTLRSYAEAITGPYSSHWPAAMGAEMASWKSTSTYVDEVPPPGANIVDGMWIFRRDYELHSLDFSTAFLQGSLHEEIWLRCPPGFTGSFRAGTQWSLRRPVYGLRRAPREWHDTLRITLVALGFAPATADPSLH
ncbi:unnamed protein product [Closterium sp. NIES-53]